MQERDDTINLWEVGRALRREKWWVFAGLTLGVAVAIVGLAVLRPQYEGEATVLLRTNTRQNPSAALGAMLGGQGGAIGDLLPDGLAGGGMDTEMEILTSRDVLGQVVDSLYLQARVLKPLSVGPAQIFADATFDPRLTEGRYDFRRQQDGYSVEGGGHRGVASPGVPYSLPGAVVTLGNDPPEEFRIELMRREAAIDRTEELLEADQAGGDVAMLVYTSDDPINAAAVPNAIFSQYEKRKRTTDRGVNQRRFEFVSARVDSVEIELASVEDQLRAHQEQTGMIDPELVGEAQLEGAMAIRTELETVSVQAAALAEVIGAAESGNARRLAGYPALLESPAVNELISQLATLETRRAALLERRTPQDPEVIGIQNSIDQIESQLASLAGSLLTGLRYQEAELRNEMGRYRGELLTLPAQAQVSLRLMRDATRLAQTQLALQMQLLETRLAAIGEGGEIRQIDVAVTPDEKSFPRTLPFLAIGLLGGLFAGLAAALIRSRVSGSIWDAADAELVSGVPTVLLNGNSPLLLGGLDVCRTVLVLPVGRHAAPEEVAHLIAGTAAGQGRAVTLLNLNNVEHAELAGEESNGSDLSGKGGALVPAGRAGQSDYLVYRILPNSGSDARKVRQALETIEEETGLVVATIPSLEHPDAAAVLSPDRKVILVGRLGELQRTELSDLAVSMRRLGIDVTGLVLSQDRGNGHHRN